MDWAALIFAGLMFAMLLAVIGLGLMLRAALNAAEPIDDIDAGSQHKPMSFFGFFSRLAWWKRDDTVMLFYRRDARGRFRKIRRH